MNTLLEFITLTKAIEYLMSITFLFIFIVFWFLLHRRGKGMIIRIIPAVVLALGFGSLAYSCISTKAVAPPAPPKVEVPLVNSGVLVEMYGPSAFDHGLHQRVVEGGCTLCHHYSSGKYSFPSCKTCHGAPFDPENLNKPGLARAFHLRCISCHRESQTGPTDCAQCHNKGDRPPSRVGHPLAGMEDCLGCHGAESPGMPRDHADTTNGVCLLCHPAQSGGEQ